MSDDARPLIDNPYRASHTPIYAGDVNVTDLMARAWDRGFAAGDERLRAVLGKVCGASVPAASPDERPTREAIEALPRWIAVEQAGYDANVNGPGPVMHAAVLLDDVLGLLAAPSHRGDEAAGTPAAVLNTEPSSGAASPDERLREALTRIERLVARWDAPIRHDVDDRVAYEKWAAVGSEAHKIAADALAAADREAQEEAR